MRVEMKWLSDFFPNLIEEHQPLTSGGYYQNVGIPLYVVSRCRFGQQMVLFQQNHLNDVSSSRRQFTTDKWRLLSKSRNSFVCGVSMTFRSTDVLFQQNHLDEVSRSTRQFRKNIFQPLMKMQPLVEVLFQDNIY